MNFSYAYCKSHIEAATSSHYQVHPLILQEFQTSTMAVVLAIGWIMKNPLSGPNAIINCNTQNMLKDMIRSISVAKTESMSMSTIEPLTKFVAQSQTKAVLNYFGNEYKLKVSKADALLPHLVKIVVECDALIESYAIRVRNDFAYACSFGCSHDVFCALRCALTDALDKSLADDQCSATVKKRSKALDGLANSTD